MNNHLSLSDLCTFSTLVQGLINNNERTIEELLKMPVTDAVLRKLENNRILLRENKALLERIEEVQMNN